MPIWHLNYKGAMKILQIIPNLASGGAERFTVDLCNKLSEDHHNIRLLTFYDRQEGDIFFDELNPKIRTVSLSKKRGVDPKLLQQLYNTIKLDPPDVIHSHLRALNYLMAVAPLLARTPIVHTVHSDAFKECTSSRLRQIRRKFFCRKNVMAVTISNESARSFSEAYKHTKNTLIINGRQQPVPSSKYIDVVNELSPYKKNNTKVFVSISRISSEKNQLMMTRAFNQLVKKEKADAILLIIGSSRDSAESKSVESELKQLVSVSEGVFLLGEKANATDYLFASDYFCLSSVYEGMPISLIEAFAAGAIPVCTPVGGIPEMINELDPSLLAQGTSEEDYFQALKNAYHLSKERQEHLHKKAVILFKEKYAIARSAKSYQRLYQTLIEAKQRK